jgi:mannose-6-phosphate isomerase-like protein (cupin superfamily)
VPEKPVFEDDPVVSKSLAPHYAVAMVLLMATLFWALWDEDFGQRPWKAFQREWKTRYSTFLKSARTESRDVQKDVEGTADYLKLKQDYEEASKSAAARTKEINEKLRDLSARILAVQNVFTDRRAYVGAATYDIETETSASAKQRKQEKLKNYEQQVASVTFPDGGKKQYNYPQLEEVYNELRNERTGLSVELGEVIKPVNERKEKLDAYVTDHMTELTPPQLTGLQNKAEQWTPKIVGEVNDFHVKLVKVQGSFEWHRHEKEDELFLVTKGRMTVRLRDRDISLEEGELVVVPRGVEHMPVAREEAWVVLLEPKSTVNTGDTGGNRTVSPEWI